MAQMASSTSGCNDINIHDTDQLQCGGAPVPFGIPAEGGTPLLFPWFLCCTVASAKKMPYGNQEHELLQVS